MTDDLIFKGKVLKVNTGITLVVKSYDWLQKLNKEHIPLSEGSYVSTDAGAIIKDIVNNSGHNIDSSVNISTGYIVDEIDLKDKTRLEAIKLLIHMVNGKDDNETYHIYDKGGNVIFDQLSDYVNDEPAISLTDNEITSISTSEDGNSLFNCATCVGDNDIRAYYPGITNPASGMEPNFPTNPSHKLINSSALKSLADCYNVARGFVISHRDIPKQIGLRFVPTRYDFFPGQLIEIDSPKWNAYGTFRLRDLSWSYSLNKSMNFTLSSIEVVKLTTFINNLVK